MNIDEASPISAEISEKINAIGREVSLKYYKKWDRMANIQKVALKKVEGCINEIQSKGLKYTEQADRVEKMPNMGKNLPIIKGIIGSHPLNETWEYRPGGKGNKLRIFIGVKDDDPSMAYLLLVDPKHEYSK